MAEETNDLAGIVGKLTTNRLKELADAIDVELEKRGDGKKPGDMSDSEFRAYVEKKLSSKTKSTNSEEKRK